MNSLVVLILTLASTGCAARRGNDSQPTHTGGSVALASSVHDKQKFIPHTGPGPFSNYLSQEVFFPPVKHVHAELQKKLGFKLINRGEAHITVITPPEYDGALKKFMSIEDINRIAIRMDLQAASFKPVCIGMGTAIRNNRTDKTFYIVVESRRLIEVRKAIENEFVAKGGRREDFSAQRFFPHITVGFTQSDLHESDGVIKDENSCIMNIEET